MSQRRKLAAALLLGLLLSVAATTPAVRPWLMLAAISGDARSFSVSAIARQVTVRILSDSGAGSGVIIQRQGQTYTVLTNEHVLDSHRDKDGEKVEKSYRILTADGQIHIAHLFGQVGTESATAPPFENLDLALLEFASPQSYRVAALGNSSRLSIEDPVYASGFPNWHWLDENSIENTRDWGVRAFRLTTGEVRMLPERSLPRGYQLGYTNNIASGMSGGPVLDREGFLVGINGRLKYPLQGIDVFAFADGTVPSQELFEQMEALSWAIPINAFHRYLRVGSIL